MIFTNGCSGLHFNWMQVSFPTSERKNKENYLIADILGSGHSKLGPGRRRAL